MTASSQPETVPPNVRVARAPSPDARLVLVSKNPRAGSKARHDHVAEMEAALAQAGFTVRTTTDLASLNDVAAECQKSGDLRAVIAVGGDGTASIVRNHVPLEVPLLVVPMGTENLLGRYLEQSSDPAAVAATVKNGVVAEFDLARAGNKYFLLMISVGFDAEVIRTLHENRRGNISRAAYFLPTLHTIRSYEYSPMRLYWDTASAPAAEPISCRWMFGFNLPLYALGLPIAPNAVGTDGMLDVCTFERGALWGVTRYLWHVARKLHHKLPDAGFHQSRRFRLEPTEGAVIPYQLDGDFAGNLPVDVEVLPSQLRLLIAPATASSLGFCVETESA